MRGIANSLNISRSKILREKRRRKGTEDEKNQKRSWKVLPNHWTLDAHCQKQWASLGVKFWGKKEEEKGPKIKKNTKCPIDAHCHRHCRRDPRIT